MPPLADRLRPTTLDSYIGQKHILGTDKLLYKSLKSGNIFSMILWGPPGVGKTTLARIIAREIEADFLEFSAVTTSIVELKKIFGDLRKEQVILSNSEGYNLDETLDLYSSVSPQNDTTKKPTIIFIDEIHRFNKAQQDAFLPFIENGTIILIGATTENPSFEVIGPLLSRSRVFVLNSLTDEELDEVIDRGIKELKVKIDKGARSFLKEISGGDARVLLNTLEIASLNCHPELVSGSSKPERAAQAGKMPKRVRHDTTTITKQQIEESIQKKALMYDKAGDEHYNTISAFIKSMRASNVDASLYYLARMIEAGEDPKFIARRMVIFASEDIGMALPTALVVANEVFRAVETIGYPEAQINLAHGVTYLATAPKNRDSYNAYFEALEDVRAHGNLPIPLKIRNAPTKLMRELDYGKGYQMYGDSDLLPEKLKGKKYYRRNSKLKIVNGK